LIGMNLAVPGAGETLSFVVIVGLIAALAAVELAVMRWLKLI